MSKRCLVIVIAEDENHEMLIRRFLRNRGLDTHEMRIEHSPAGAGSAESWVRKRFPVEVNAYRRRHARTGLIAIIDADTVTVQHRLRQFDQALKEAGKQSVDPNNEQIARLVPKRNVETWILCLIDQAVEEETDYKNTRSDWNELIPRAAETLGRWTRLRDGLPESCTDSLEAGVRELKRLQVLDR